jgi:hypothetical protein
MSKRVTIAKAGAAALAGVIALGAAAQVQAQPAPPYTAYSGNGYYYDPCRRDAAQRGTAGALIGGGMGAVIGSNAAARNARTEGALLGGLLGAIAGGVVGNKTAACTSGYYNNAPPPPPPPASTSSDSYYDRDAYAGRTEYRYEDRDNGDDDTYVYGHGGERYRLADRAPDPDGCALAESPIYMPDGRTQTRFVRVCRDSSGRYAVVD